MSDHELELEFALARDWMLRRNRPPTHLGGGLWADFLDGWYWQSELLFHKHRQSDAFRQYVAMAEKDKLD